MPYLHSIQSIEKVFDTGCRPLLVHCSDLNYYVCKYNTGATSADRLFREYLASSFLKIWNIPTPDFAFVNIMLKHLPAGLGVNINLNCPAFGSLYQREYKELDAFSHSMNDYQSNRYSERQDFLSIAFFDLWLANDDRHPGHYNLFVTGNGDLHFVAFDHEQIFNGGNLDKGLYELSQEASILSSPLLFKLFSRKELGDRAFYEPLFQNWYLCMQSCKAV